MSTNKNGKKNSNKNASNNNMPANEVAQLEAQLAAARQRQAEQDAARREAVTQTVQGFPAALGVSTLADVIREIRTVMRTQGNPAGVGRRLLTNEQKAGIRDALTAATETSEAIANRFGVSIPTVQAIKKAMGLVKARVAKVETVS